MTMEFIKNTQKFGVRKAMEAAGVNEAIVKFDNMGEIRTFFNNAMNNQINSDVIQRIASEVAPNYCCASLKRTPQLSSHERLDFLFSEIAKGNANVVLKSNSFKLEPKTTRPSGSEAEKDFPGITDILKFAEKQVNHLRKVYSSIVHADYSVFEKVYTYDENSTGYVPATIDPSSEKEHSTGWTSWDNPFDISVLGLFKGMVAFRVGEFLNIGSMALAAGGFAAGSENITGQYLATGKSIVTRKWYGSYAIRYNIKSCCWQIPWIEHKESGPDQRILVELKRQDRLLMHDKVIYTHQALLVPPFTTMEEYLNNYSKGTALPEHDVKRPINLGRFFTAFS